MAIFRECKHSFHIVQALFGKSASTLVFFASQPFSFPIARLRRQIYEFRLSPCGHCLQVLRYEIASGVLGQTTNCTNCTNLIFVEMESVAFLE